MHTIQQIVSRPFQSRSFITRYGVALASVLLVLLLRSLLHPILGSRSQYIVFLLSVLVTAWYSGSIPALMTLALGAFLGNTFFSEPYFTFKLEGLSDSLAIFTYLLIGVIIIYLFEVIKRREAKLAAQIVKQAEIENALRLSEERFRLATEALQGVIYDWDAATDVAYRSPGLVEILGYQPNEITNNRKWWQSQIHPEDFERVQQDHKKTIAQRAPTHSVEYRVRHKDGHYVWVWDNSRIIYNAEGQPIRLIGNTLSIDERERLAESLVQSEERFRLATEALNGLIYDVDFVTGAIYRSSGLFEIVGYYPHEVPPDPKWWHDKIFPDDLKQIQQKFEKTVAQQGPTQADEYRVRHKDGRYVWVWDNSRIIYDTGGQPIRIIGTTVSIDERKTLVDTLAQTEERFRLAFENATDAMALSDQDGLVVAANQAYVQLYGYSAEEVIGHNYAIIYPEESRQQSITRYQQIFNSLHELPVSDSIVRRKDGTERTVEARIGFVAPGGQRMYMLSVIRDLTERKQVEREILVRYQLTADLAHAVTVEDVGRVTVEHIMRYLGSIAGNVYVYHAGDNVIEMLYSKADMTEDERALLLRFPADSSYPMGDVAKHNQPLLFSSYEQRIAAYPLTEQFSHEAPGALMVLPLVVASEVFGVISIMFSEERGFPESEQAFVSSLVFQCAQAIERARLADQARELAVMHERQRLARDLHDNVNQLLFSSSVISEMLPRIWDKQPEKARRLADQLHLMVQGAMAEMRTLLWELRPESIVQTQLSSLLTQLSYAVRARQETEISVTIRADHETLLPPDVQVTFYRIAQESVHNIVKHGHAATISILMRQTDEYTALIVMDDGQGFDTTAGGGGFGLRNMQERAASIGAQFSIKSRIAKGTRMRLLWMTPPPSVTDQLEIKNPDATPLA